PGGIGGRREGETESYSPRLSTPSPTRLFRTAFSRVSVGWHFLRRHFLNFSGDSPHSGSHGPWQEAGPSSTPFQRKHGGFAHGTHSIPPDPSRRLRRWS